MLSTKTIEHLIEIAKEEAPREMCGLLFDRTSMTVFAYMPNSHPKPTEGFLILHDDYMTECEKADAKPWALVHSHPGKGAAPSVADCQLMDALQIANQHLAMVIVGLEPVEIRCFTKRGDRYWLEWSHTMYDADRREFLCSGSNDLR